jgi:hypothetical protein
LFNIVAFIMEIEDLVRDGHITMAEERLLKASSELRATDSVEELEIVVGRLARLYAMPGNEDLEKAEGYFLEREVLSPGSYPKSQTAMFYFYGLGDWAKTVRKVEEIKPSEVVADRASYYTALALQGHALINLEKLSEANKTLEKAPKSYQGGSFASSIWRRNESARSSGVQSNSCPKMP